MKKLYFYLLCVAMISFSFHAKAQITIDNTLTIEELVNDVLLGDGVTVSNVTYNGLPGDQVSVQAGTFDATGTNFLINEGVLMSTSYLEIVNEGGGNNNAGVTPVFPDSSDADLEIIANNTPHNACVIEFDFTASSDSVKFEYVFSSAEYPGFTCSSFNDAFGFFLSGPGITGPYEDNATNIALIPNSDVAVAINSLNSGSPANDQDCLDMNPNYMVDSQYFEPNSPVDPNNIQIEGYTHVLTAEHEIECGETYHIKLAVANAGDQQLQTAVFLQKGSFSATGEVFVDVVPTIGGAAVIDPQYSDVIVAGCSDFGIELTRPTGASVDSVFVVFGGTAIQDEDYVLGANDTLFFFPDGTDTLNYYVETLWDGIPDEDEVIEIMVIYAAGCSVDADYDTAYASIPFVDPYALESSSTGIELVCPLDLATVSAQGENGIGPYMYDWGNGLTGDEVTIPDPPGQNEQAYYVVGITDACDFEIKLDSVLVINSIPDSLNVTIDPFEQPTCPNEPVMLTADVQDGNPGYNYVWTTVTGSPIANSEDATAQFIDSTDVVLMIVDDCNTIVRDTTSIFYPYFDSLIVSFPQLVNNCPSSPVELNAEFTGGAGETEFIWSQIEGEGEFVMSPSEQETAITPSTGMNIYMVTATDRCFRQNYFGRTPGTSVYVDSLKTIDLSNLPNVITPNNDNKNEFFAVAGVEEFKNARLEVFDRWGKMVFETDNYQAGSADGKYDDAFDGKDLEDGTYFYVINVEKGECIQSGTIQILGSNN